MSSLPFSFSENNPRAPFLISKSSLEHKIQSAAKMAPIPKSPANNPCSNTPIKVCRSKTRENILSPQKVISPPTAPTKSDSAAVRQTPFMGDQPKTILKEKNKKTKLKTLPTKIPKGRAIMRISAMSEILRTQPTKYASPAPFVCERCWATQNAAP